MKMCSMVPRFCLSRLPPFPRFSAPWLDPWPPLAYPRCGAAGSARGEGARRAQQLFEAEGSSIDNKAKYPSPQ